MLHTFGCSITQGFALPDTVRSLTDSELRALGRPMHWTDVHLLKPSSYAWPSVLAQKLGTTVHNHARRGACTQQISRQCAAHSSSIVPGDTVIVMWTYLSRISLQWPARTSVPFCNVVEPKSGWKTMILGFNKFFGLDPSDRSNDYTEDRIQTYIHNSIQYAQIDPLGVYNRYYNNLVLQTMTDGYLRATGARVIHLSVEPESYADQLENVRQELDASLREPYVIPDPVTWYTMHVDHDLCRVIHDPSIPPAENDMHPSVTHHSNFAQRVYDTYFKTLEQDINAE